MKPKEISSKQNWRSKLLPKILGLITKEQNHDGLDAINFHFSIFSLFVGLAFAYFVYFSYKSTELQSSILSKIIEINVIDLPHPMQSLTISGHKKYYYQERREALILEFQLVMKKILKPNVSETELSQNGSELGRIITQIAYFFPYKKLLDFKKDGGVVFEPNIQESIDTSKPINFNFLKAQIDEIIDLNYRFTLELKDGKTRVIEALIAAGNFKNDYTKSRIGLYVESLIVYLENHYKLAVPLGLTIKEYDFFSEKINKPTVVSLTILLSANFLFGVLLPLLISSLRNKRVILIIVQATFITGLIFLFKESLYSFPF